MILAPEQTHGWFSLAVYCVSCCFSLADDAMSGKLSCRKFHFKRVRVEEKMHSAIRWKETVWSPLKADEWSVSEQCTIKLNQSIGVRPYDLLFLVRKETGYVLEAFGENRARTFETLTLYRIYISQRVFRAAHYRRSNVDMNDRYPGHPLDSRIPALHRGHSRMSNQTGLNPWVASPFIWGNGGSGMANKRHKTAEIVTKLRQVEAVVYQGMARINATRKVRITKHTFYRWRKQYGEMGTAQFKELKPLQKENERLQRVVSDRTLDELILTAAARWNF